MFPALATTLGKVARGARMPRRAGEFGHPVGQLRGGFHWWVNAMEDEPARRSHSEGGKGDWEMVPRWAHQYTGTLGIL